MNFAPVKRGKMLLGRPFEVPGWRFQGIFVSLLGEKLAEQIEIHMNGINNLFLNLPVFNGQK
jgi:hypothetical protein